LKKKISKSSNRPGGLVYIETEVYMSLSHMQDACTSRPQKHILYI